MQEQQRRKRRRGRILTEQGWQKLNDAFRESETGEKLTNEEIAEKSKLSVDTISKIMNREDGADKQSIEQLFRCLGLQATKYDYCYLDEEQDYPNLSQVATLHINNEKDDTLIDTNKNSTDTDFYLERSSFEHRCYEAILQPGCVIRIKAPWHMGKTSLINKIIYHAKKQGYLTVLLKFSPEDTETSLDQFLRWFCACISKHLNESELKIPLSSNLNDYWDNTYGSKYNCTHFFEENLLQKIPENSILLLSLDNIDSLDKNRKIANEFFDLLRNWCEEAQRQNTWKKLRLVLAYSRKIYIDDIYRSPFNVGEHIELLELTLEEIKQLGNLYQLTLNIEHVQQIMQIVGGHPYLVKLAIKEISRNRHTRIEKFLTTAFTYTGIYREHLEAYLFLLDKHPYLKDAMRNVVNSTVSVRLELTQALELESIGLVKLEGNDAKPRCELYRQYFQKYL
ncbi:hypothetical protein DSM106972_092800 [Dulcicalothrix desertica PCC 7102]|uniref:HTH cro/C1-type domain-containing protein n=2 Tax=Dulcicalothrix desertica TaxID=32056 RepID=A0A433ULA1_9CYAN|nr:hypothetical protein DSM106972_092800 [Dulcicalothrix desertica PCC 7102]TWH62537.1 AAA domain-containing protein [Dulcicalothrix desertica PCC 7102]